MRFSYSLTTFFYIFALMNINKREFFRTAVISIAGTAAIVILFNRIADIPLP